MTADSGDGQPRLGGGARLAWADLPHPVRAQVEEILGGPVVTAMSQPGGFSPGSADRVITAGGRRAFVKSASAQLNADSRRIHAREATVLDSLPDGLPVARLVGVVEHGDWIALVLDDVDGHHPHLPWRPGELDAVLDALARLADRPVAAELAGLLPPLRDELAGLFDGWNRVDDATVLPLEPSLAGWCAEHLDDLRRLAAEALELVPGDRLVHLDARADNLLLGPDGRVVVVDWPWAAVGAGWFDAVTLLINVRLYDPGYDVEAVLATHPVFTDLPPDAVDAVLAGMAGFFIPTSLEPPPPGLPTLRAFQRDQGAATLDWLRQRRDG